MRAAFAFAALVLLLVGPEVGATVPTKKAKEKLRALKGRLPGVVKAWAKATLGDYHVAVFKRVRATGDTEAKVIVHVYWEFEGRKHSPEVLLTVLLRYYDGLWTAMRFEWSHSAVGADLRNAGHFLLDAIDEAAEK